VCPKILISRKNEKTPRDIYGMFTLGVGSNPGRMSVGMDGICTKQLKKCRPRTARRRRSFHDRVPTKISPISWTRGRDALHWCNLLKGAKIAPITRSMRKKINPLGKQHFYNFFSRCVFVLRVGGGAAPPFRYPLSLITIRARLFCNKIRSVNRPLSSNGPD
jgi:hypothetical protein